MANEITILEFKDIDPDLSAPMHPPSKRATATWTNIVTLDTGTRAVTVKANSASYVRFSKSGATSTDAEATSADYKVDAGQTITVVFPRVQGTSPGQVHSITQ